MRIGVDGGCWNNRRGYGRFLREIVAAIQRRGSHHKFTIFLDAEAAPDFTAGDPFEIVPVRLSASPERAAVADGRRSLADIWRMSRAVSAADLDVFFYPAVYSYFPLLRRIPSIAGIHDAIVDRNPKFGFTSKRNRIFWTLKSKVAVGLCSHILTVSQYSRRTIASHYGIDERRILVLPEAAAPIFYPDPLPREGARFILAAGGLSLNKNLETLIRAFARIAPQYPSLRLVLPGALDAGGFLTCAGALRALARELNLPDRIDFPGYVTDDQLRRLYSTADVFAMISLDEGFGLPVVEAMACGAPVIASNAHALREVAAGAGVLVDPNSVSDVADALDRVLGDEELQRKLRAASLARAAEFSWDRSAGMLIEFLERVGAGR